MLRDQERPVRGDRCQRDLDQVILRATREKQQCPAIPPPTITPASIFHASNPAIAVGSTAEPPAIATSTVKPTAAVPSFSRLSASTSSLRRGSTFSSLNAAITDTGSVAAIRTPNMAAPSQLPADQDVHASCNEGGGNGNPDKRQKENHRKIAAERRPSYLKCGFEYKRGQQDCENGIWPRGLPSSFTQLVHTASVHAELLSVRLCGTLSTPQCWRTTSLKCSADSALLSR